jgi:transcriptional regulator with XRE-family HTH domain
MESADPFNLTFVLYKCIIILLLQYFKAKSLRLQGFVRIHKMPTQNLYDSITLAENIKLQAKARNVQLKDMFAELGMSKGTLSNLRTGRMMAADSLARISDYLDCSMDFLMGRTVDPAVKRMNLTDDERQKVTDYLQFILSQRK